MPTQKGPACRQAGAAPVLLLLAGLGLLTFIFVTNTFNFKGKLFSTLFPRPASIAVEGTRIEAVDTQGSIINQTETRNIKVKLTFVPPPTPSPTPVPSPTSAPIQQPLPDTNTSRPDLDVTYIERTPRYFRYDVFYPNNLPTLRSGTENQKRWPDVGENITYTAHIINKGGTLQSSTYRWLVDGQAISSGTLSSNLLANQEAKITLQSTFPQNPQKIEFVVDPSNTISESVETNNSLRIGSHDLTLSYWVEQQYYDTFNNTANMVGSFSFEDWIQAHFAKINERFAQAKYPTAPDGIKDRVRIDKIVIENDIDGPGSQFHNDPDAQLIDGKWQSSDGDPSNARGQGGEVQNYVQRFATTIDWGLIHEVTHQLGVIDLYRMNIKNNEPASPNGGVLVKDINGTQIPYNNLNFPVFINGGVMGGGETTPYNDGTYYDSHTAGGFNSNYLKRRGYFGEYLFDTPNNTKIKVVDSTGNPISGTQVNLYQKDPDSEDIDNLPEYSGVTDSLGEMALQNKPVNGITTATGHTLKQNPFGQIRVVGTNGTMIAKVTKGNQEGYGFFRLYDLNVAYWSGNRDSATITVKTNYPKLQQAVLGDTASSLPTHFRIANTPTELENATEQLFNSNPTTIDWTLSDGSGQKTIYAQFKIDGVWQPTILSYSLIYSPPTPTPTPTSVPSPSPSPTSNSTSSPTATPVPTSTPIPLLSLSPTPSSSSNPSVSPSPSPTPIPIAYSTPAYSTPSLTSPRLPSSTYISPPAYSTPAAPAPVSGNNTYIPPNPQTQKSTNASPAPTANITKPAPPPNTTVFTPPSFKLPELKEEQPTPQPTKPPGVFGGFVNAVNSFNDNLIQTLLKFLQNFGLLKNTET